MPTTAPEGVAAPPDSSTTAEGLAWQLARSRQAVPPTPNSPQATAPSTTAAEPEAPVTDEDAPNLSQPDLEPAAEETPPELDPAAHADETLEDPAAPEEAPEIEAEPEESELDPKLQAKIDKRIGKEVAKRKKAEAELADLRAQVSSPEPATPPGPDPLSEPAPAVQPFSARAQEIEQACAAAKSHIQWCEANPDGGEVEGTDGKVHAFTAEQVRAIKTGAMDVLIDRRAELNEYKRDMAAQHAHYDRLAVEHYPWFADKKCAQFTAASKVLQAYPEFKNFPGWKLALGDMIAGRDVRQSKQNPKRPAAAPAKPTRLPGAPAVPAPKAPANGEVTRSKAQDRFEKEGTVDALAASFAAKRHQNAIS